jgi:hypothetical protein
MANSFPGSGLAYADAFSVGNASSVNSSLYVCSNCIQAVRIEHVANQENLHHNTLWLRANNAGSLEAASIGFTVVNDGGDHHRANIAATGNAGTLGGNLAIYTRRNSDGADVLGFYQNNTANVGIGITDPIAKLHVEQTTTGEVARFRANVAGCADVVIVNNAQTWGFRVDNAASNALHIRNFQNSTNTMTLTTGGNIGIGIYTPNAPLHVQGPSGDGTAVFRVTSTSAADSFNYAGALINACLCSNRNYIFMIGQDLSNRNSGYIGYNHTGTTNSNNNFLTFGHFQSDNLLNLLGNGNLGVGTTSPTYKLQVNGTFYAAGSSQEYKTSVCQYDTDSCMFMKLKPVTYQYKDEYKHLGKELKSETQIGLIAEEVAETYPELAILVKENDNDVVRNVDYEKLSIVLLAEVQKLRKEVDDLKTK